MSDKPCTFEGCTNNIAAQGLCMGHRKQRNTGKELTPLRAYKRRPPAPDGYAFCNRCENYKPLGEFFFLKERNAPRHWCKQCVVDANREARHARKATQHA